MNDSVIPAGLWLSQQDGEAWLGTAAVVIVWPGRSNPPILNSLELAFLIAAGRVGA